eukprot:324859-Lingulodinium_polyedra.AAC.1
MLAFIGGGADDDEAIEADAALLKASTLAAELSGMPLAQDNILRAVQALNEKCLQELLDHGGLPIFHYTAKEPELEVGDK